MTADKGGELKVTTGNELSSTNDHPDNLTRNEEASLIKDRYAECKEFHRLTPTEKIEAKNKEIKHGLESQLQKLETNISDLSAHNTQLLYTVQSQKETIEKKQGELDGYVELKVSHRHLKQSQWVTLFFYGLSPFFAFVAESEERLTWFEDPTFIVQLSFWLCFIFFGIGALIQMVLYFILKS